MGNPVAFLKRASGGSVNVFVTSLAMAVAGLIFLPIGCAVQAASGPALSSDQGPLVGYSIGRIKKIDIERAAVTLKHGPIASLGMPDMTMIFRVADPRQLAGLNVGDQVRFKVRNIKGAMVIAEIDSVR